MDIINLYDKYNSYFSNETKAVFEKLSKVAEEFGYKIYLIGGMVRDLILNRETLDIDITVEGDAIKFAEILKNKKIATISSIHKDFGTAKIEINGKNIDLASTRSENYPQKGHLPHIDKIGCSLENDVKRRDFTINSLALSLNQGNFANLIDYFDGYSDLLNKKIKILHDKSFIDDPTRIIRALKYSTRLSFELDKETLKLQEDYLNNVNYDMCYKRIKQEIKKTFEQNLQVAFDKFIEQGIYKLLTKSNRIQRHAELVSASGNHSKLERFRNGFEMTQHFKVELLVNRYKPKFPWLVYFGVIALQLDISKISLTKYEDEVIKSSEKLKDVTFTNDFEIYKAFSSQKIETLLILAAIGHKEEIIKYLDKLSTIKIKISGNDLIKLGMKPSKKFAEIFDKILKEKIMNPSLSKQDELIIAMNYLN